MVVSCTRATVITQGSADISPKLKRIAKLAKDKPGVALLTLAHHIDMNWMREAFRRTRKDGAAGIDGVAADECAKQLEDDLRALLDRQAPSRGKEDSAQVALTPLEPASTVGR